MMAGIAARNSLKISVDKRQNGTSMSVTVTGMWCGFFLLSFGGLAVWWRVVVVVNRAVNNGLFRDDFCTIDHRDKFVLYQVAPRYSFCLRGLL